MEENKNISIKGNETIEELVKKVTTVESIDDKLSICVMIISHLEMKNSVRPGSYTHAIGSSKKYPPKDPKEREKLFSHIGTSDRESDINTFLFLLKKWDENCYLELVNTFEKISAKEDTKEKLITWGCIVGFIIIVYFLLKDI